METSSASYLPLPPHGGFPKRYSSSTGPPLPPQTPRNRVHLQPASPEVISSLITSLSSISSQAEKHFDAFTADEDLAYASTHLGAQRLRSGSLYDKHINKKETVHQNGFGVDYGAYRSREVEETADSTIPDAAIPPVVRMGKQRNLSPLDTSQRKLRLKRSTSSLRSRSADSLSASVIQSAEPTSPRKSSFVSYHRSQKLAKRASKESMQSIEGQEKKLQGFLGDDLPMPSSSNNNRTLRNTPSSRSLMEERIEEAIIEHDSSPDKSRRSNGPSPVLTPDSQSPGAESPGGLGSGRAIPSRQSSLRHSFSGSPAKQKKAARHSRHSSAGLRDFKVDDDLPEEEDGVVKRIRELQLAKQRRDEEFQAVTGENTRRSRQRQTHPVSAISGRSDSRQHARHPETETEAIHGTKHDQAQAQVIDLPAPSPAIATGKNRSQKKADLGRAYSSSVPTQGSTKSLDGNRITNTSTPSSPKRASSVRDTRRSSGAFSPTRTSFGEGRPSTSDSIDEAVEAYLSAPRLSQKVRHPQSGRTIAFSEVGDPNGFVVFCCVGMGLTRYLTAFYDELAKTLKLRLITPDRPGVGESEPCLDGTGTPLAWPDDVAIICSHLKITKFSLLAHSAGAIYALATALRMPQQIRGRIHLLAPWIPPSQMSSIGPYREPLPSGAVPYSHRILRALPASFLKAANSSFMSATSASITSSLPKSPRRSTGKRKSMPFAESPVTAVFKDATDDNKVTDLTNGNEDSTATTEPQVSTNAPPVLDPTTKSVLDSARAHDYEETLTHAIWHLATTNSNPALDLVTCLERRRPIGFRYVDITRAVVIHHGSRDSRVPVENVKWLGKVMRRCEVRILEGEGHGLMAVAGVMGRILTEIATEWEDWAVVTQGKRERRGRTGASGNGHAHT